MQLVINGKEREFPALSSTSKIADLIAALDLKTDRVALEHNGMIVRRDVWRDTEIQQHGERVKHMKHPQLGPIAFEYSAFAIDGRPDLSMVIYNPIAATDLHRIRSLIDQRTAELR